MQIFAARAGTELERLHAEEALRATLTELEMLKNRLQAENVYLQEELRHEHNFEEIVGNSPALLEMLRQIESVAATDATVLICGVIEGLHGAARILNLCRVHTSVIAGRPGKRNA